MRKIDFIITIALLLILCSCKLKIKYQPHDNKNSFLDTYSREDGLKFESFNVLTNGKEVKTSEFDYGGSVLFRFNNVSGFNTSDRQIKAGLSLSVINNDNDSLIDTIYTENLFNIRDLQEKINITAPFNYMHKYKPNINYRSVIRIKDLKGNGSFIFKLSYKVKKNEWINIEEKGIDCSNVFLYNSSKDLLISKPILNSKDTFHLVLDGIDGLELFGNRVHPDITLSISDYNGQIVEYLKNAEKALNPEDLKEKSIYIPFTLPPTYEYSRYQLKAVLSDPHSEKKLEITSELISLD